MEYNICIEVYNICKHIAKDIRAYITYVNMLQICIHGTQYMYGGIYYTYTCCIYVYMVYNICIEVYNLRTHVAYMFTWSTIYVLRDIIYVYMLYICMHGICIEGCNIFIHVVYMYTWYTTYVLRYITYVNILQRIYVHI